VILRLEIESNLKKLNKKAEELEASINPQQHQKKRVCSQFPICSGSAKNLPTSKKRNAQKVILHIRLSKSGIVFL
jgi:hypothetical protein